MIKDRAAQLFTVTGFAVADEPNNLELHFVVAGFDMEASGDRPELLERCRAHTDRDAELGPKTASGEQEQAETDYQAAPLL